MFTYPQEFVEKAKQIYPSWDDLHFLLGQNSKRVGGLLYDARGLSIDEDQIVSLFRNNKQDKVLEAAKRAQAKRELYNEWSEIVDKFADSMAEQNGYEL